MLFRSFNPVVETQLLSSEMCVTKASLPMLSPTGSPQEVEVGKYSIVFEPMGGAERSFKQGRKAKELNLEQKIKDRRASVSPSLWVCRAGECSRD